MKDRIDWVDIAKGIGIILIVFGHNLLPPYIRQVVFAFHVPLFFFLSGMFFNTRCNLKQFIIDKYKKLVIPYFIFAITTYIFWFFVTSRFDNYSHKTIPFIGIFYGNGTDPWMMFNAPRWFIVCLFSTEILFYFVYKAAKGKYKLIFALIIISVIGFLYSKFVAIRLPWGIDICFTSIIFYGTGYLFKNYFNIKKVKKTLVVFLIPCFAVLTVMFSTLNGLIDMNYRIYNNYFFFYLAAFFGIFTIILLSTVFPNLKLIKYYGQNTLVILALHIVILKLYKGFFIFVLKSNYKTTENPLFLPLLFTLFVMISIIPIIHTINKK
jgi:acyltransferase